VTADFQIIVNFREISQAAKVFSRDWHEEDFGPHLQKALISFVLDRARPCLKILLYISGIYSLKAQNRSCRDVCTKFANKLGKIRRRHLPTRRFDPRWKFYPGAHWIKLPISEELANV